MSEEELEALLGIGCCEYHRDIGIEAKKEIERLNNDYLEMKDNFRTANDEIERLRTIIKKIKELRKYLSNKYYELSEEVDIGVIIEHIDRILDKENKNE